MTGGVGVMNSPHPSSNNCKTKSINYLNKKPGPLDLVFYFFCAAKMGISESSNERFFFTV